MKDDLLESKITFRITDDVKAYIQNVANLESGKLVERINRVNQNSGPTFCEIDESSKN